MERKKEGPNRQVEASQGTTQKVHNSELERLFSCHSTCRM